MAVPSVSKWEKNTVKNELNELNIILMRYNLKVSLKYLKK